MVLWPVPYRLSKRCLVSASFTAMIGKLQRTVLRHRPKPDHAGGGLLGPRDDVVEQLATSLVQLGDEVRSVIHRHLRVRVEHRLDVRVIAAESSPLTAYVGMPC